jgi:tetratricopeptide (TPR) repeat protein
MSAIYRGLFWTGIFVTLCLQSSVVLADTAAPSTPAASSVSAVPVKPADPKKLVEQAEDKLDDEDLAAAIFLYNQAAQLNYTPAQVALGNFAESGEFFDTAVGWYLMAAMQGDAAGQFHLAQMYQSGRGIEQDDMKALYWYRRSAAQDYVPAIKVIAFAYNKGGFSGQIQADPDRAKTWYNKAAHLEAVQKKAADEEMTKKREAKLEELKKRKEMEKANKGS